MAMATTVLCFEALRQRTAGGSATHRRERPGGAGRHPAASMAGVARPRRGASLPFVVAVVRAAVTDWMPVGDAAYFTVRSGDVLTSHHPLSARGRRVRPVVGVPVNNLGPLQLDVLAPFTKVSPYVGTAVGSALINAASVVDRVVRRQAACSARRSSSRVMVGTILFVASLGLSWLIDARQQ